MTIFQLFVAHGLYTLKKIRAACLDLAPIIAALGLGLASTVPGRIQPSTALA